MKKNKKTKKRKLKKKLSWRTNTTDFKTYQI